MAKSNLVVFTAVLLVSLIALSAQFSINDEVCVKDGQSVRMSPCGTKIGVAQGMKGTALATERISSLDCSLGTYTWVKIDIGYVVPVWVANVNGVVVDKCKEGQNIKGEIAADYARDQLYKGYSTVQRTGPSTFDSTGLAHKAWEAAGRAIPYIASSYSATTMKIVLNESDLELGDILYSSTGHVGIFVGDGVISAEPIYGVKLRTLSNYKSIIGFTTIYRPYE